MAVALTNPKFYAWNRNGKPLAFGKLYTYQTRTNIPLATFKTENVLVANTNPVILNGEGYADVYLQGTYKLVLKDAQDNEVWTADPVSDSAGSGITGVTESQPLADGQTTVVFNDIETSTAVFHLCGQDVDQGRLCTDQYTVLDDKTIELTESYPEGSSITATSQDPTVKQPAEVVLNFAELNDAVIDTGLVAGDALNIKERSAGNGGGAMWDVVLASTVAPNGSDIVQCTGVPSLALVMRNLEAVYSVATVAELEATDLIPGQTARTQGYYTQGDGGGADYLIAASQAVDGVGDRALDNGNVALLQIVDNINVKQFGAVDDYDPATGTVTTDSLPAFNAARDRARRSSGLNRKIYVPGSNYYLSDVWDLTSQFTPPGVQNLNIEFEKRNGEFEAGTLLFGGGGDTAAVVDTSGSDGITTINMGLRRALVGGARVGLLQARTEGAGETGAGLDQKHLNLYVDMGSDSSFADNFGTFGYVNVAAEESSLENAQIWANTPIVHTSTKNLIKTGDTFDNTANDSIDLGQFSARPLTVAGSNTVFRWYGQSRIIAYDYISPCLLINNAATLDCGAMFMQKRESDTPGVTIGVNNWAIDSWNCFGFKIFGSVEGCKSYHIQRRAFEDFEINCVLNEDVTVPGDLRSAWVFFDDGGAYTCRRGKAVIRNNNVAGVLGGKRGDASAIAELPITITNCEWQYSRSYGDQPLDKRVLRKMLTACSVKYEDFSIDIPYQGMIEFQQSNVNILRRNDPPVDVLDVIFPNYQANLGSAAISLSCEGVASNVSLAGGAAASVGFPAVNSFKFTTNAVRQHNVKDIFVSSPVTVTAGDGVETSAVANIINTLEITVTDDDVNDKITLTLHPDTGAGANNAEVFVNLKYVLYWSGGVEEAVQVARLA